MPRPLALLGLLLLALAAGCNVSTSTSSPSEASQVGLSVGKFAPTLEGADTKGNPIKLSDFKGKVVVLDFWATWCPPCRAMIPHEKALVKRMEGRPFQFLSVSADRQQSALTEYMEKNEITWPNIYDGPGSPRSRAWEIEFLPSIFVIDARGVIRFTDVRDEQLERAVDQLVAEAEAK